MKKDLVVSFSGGRTSGYMCKWLIDNTSHIFNLHFVFANTGQEHRTHTNTAGEIIDLTFFRERRDTKTLLEMSKGDFKAFKDLHYEECAEECGSVIPEEF